MQLRSVQRPQHTQLQNLGTVQQQCLHMPVIYEITGALVRELISCFLHAVNGTFTRFLIVWQALSCTQAPNIHGCVSLSQWLMQGSFGLFISDADSTSLSAQHQILQKLISSRVLQSS